MIPESNVGHGKTREKAVCPSFTRIPHWVESLEDVAKHITKKPEENFKEIDYLILKDNIAIGSFHVHTISYLDHEAVSEALQLVLSELKCLGFNKAVINCDKGNIRFEKVIIKAQLNDHLWCCIQTTFDSGIEREAEEI